MTVVAVYLMGLGGTFLRSFAGIRERGSSLLVVSTLSDSPILHLCEHIIRLQCNSLERRG